VGQSNAFFTSALLLAIARAATVFYDLGMRKHSLHRAARDPRKRTGLASLRKPPHQFYDGERRQYHLRLPDPIHNAMSRYAAAEQAKRKARVTLNEVWDTASAWFIRQWKSVPKTHFEHPDREARHKTLWIATPLVEELKKIAEQEGLPLARVIHTVGASYVEYLKTR
jgi:hypothetical protein